MGNSCTVFGKRGPHLAKTKSKSGPKPQFGEAMEFRVSIILTAKQARKIQEVAAAKGKSASAWAREIVLAALPEDVG
jgi:hypothetical protein